MTEETSTVEKVVEKTVKESKVDGEEALRQERIAACNTAINDVLKKHECTLDVSIMLRRGQVIPNIQIIPVEMLKPQEEAA